MLSSSNRRELVDRLHYTFVTADYDEIDVLIAALRQKDNYEALCEEFFHGCRIDSKGYLVPGGFFQDAGGSASLLYSMYELLGTAPETFLLKHRVSRVRLLRRNLSGRFRFPRSVFRLPRLEILVVRGIGISRLPQTIEEARELRILDLSGNRIVTLPDSLLKVKRLSALNLSYNRIEHLPEKIGRLKRLRVLTLRGNLINELPKDWHRLQYLRKLDLSMNRITEIPDSLRTLVSLRDLKLSYNNLSASVEAQWEKRFTNGESRKGSQGSLGIGG